MGSNQEKWLYLAQQEWRMQESRSLNPAIPFLESDICIAAIQKMLDKRVESD
jgi:hypothetical protein